MVDKLKNYIELYAWNGWILKELSRCDEKVKHPEHYIVDLDTNDIYEIEMYTYKDHHTEENYKLIRSKDKMRVTRLLNYIDRKKLLNFNSVNTRDYGEVLVINKKNIKQEISLSPNTNIFKELVRIVK